MAPVSAIDASSSTHRIILFLTYASAQKQPHADIPINFTVHSP
jgi:hypothetical protein